MRGFFRVFCNGQIGSWHLDMKASQVKAFVNQNESKLGGKNESANPNKKSLNSLQKANPIFGSSKNPKCSSDMPNARNLKKYLL